MSRATVGLVVASLVLTACSSKKASAPTTAAAPGTPVPKESAGDAVKRQFDFLAKGQFGREWDELHPAQQQVVPRGKFEECGSQAGLTQVSDIQVKETYRDPLDLASVPEKSSMAVTVSEKANGRTSTATFHEVNVGGQWRWVLADSAVAAYKAGRCPS